ncbi:MAG: hypothetical protein QHH07_11050 [Sedimentisphaerales bacterium]|nr:hypothetical protein [Sedimentisphaerales bacterium]
MVTVPIWAGWSGLIIWLILAAVLFAKANRKIQAWAILIPVVIVLALWRWLELAARISGPSRPVFASALTGQVVGLAVICLLADAIGRFRWYWRIVAACLIILVAIGIAIRPMHVLGTSPVVVTAVSLGIESLVLLFAVLLMALASRRRFTRAKAIIWFVIVAGTGSVIALACLVSPIVRQSIQLQELGFVALILSATVLALALPFLILMLISPFWQARLAALLGQRRPLTPASMPADPAQPAC